jgi:hypothetical protein
VSDRYRVERHDEFDGTSTWHVFDRNQGDQSVAQFDDEQAARDRAAELEGEDASTPNTGGTGDGDVPPTVP